MKRRAIIYAGATLLAGACFVGCKTPFSWGKKSADPAAAQLSASAPSTNPITKAWKSTTSSVSSAFKPKPTALAADDATNLNFKGAKVTSEIHVEAASVFESQGKYAEAKSQYEQALKLSPKDEGALVGLARIYDMQGDAANAEATYIKCKKAHPKSAVVMNDLGLHYAKQKNLAAATSHFRDAVKLAPMKANYRNNLATQLVQSGKSDEALKELKALNPPAVAHYNLACLQTQFGESSLAAQNLRTALSLDQSMNQASELLSQIEGVTPVSGMAAAGSQNTFTLPQQPSTQVKHYFTGSRKSVAAPAGQDLAPPEVYEGEASAPQGGPYSAAAPGATGSNSVYGN